MIEFLISCFLISPFGLIILLVILLVRILPLLSGLIKELRNIREELIRIEEAIRVNGKGR